MSIAIIGKNRINELLAGRLNRKGLDTLIIEDIDCIGNIEGEAGNFLISVIGNSSGNLNNPNNPCSLNIIDSIPATHIIITGEPDTASFPGIDGFAPLIALNRLTGQCKDGDSQYEGNDNLDQYRNNMPVAFLLDYPEESEGYNTSCALSKAIEFARRKRKVFYIFKFMRTAGSTENSLEKLYLEARNSGVTFIRYDDISVKYDGERDSFCIKVMHEMGDVTAEAGLLVWAAPFTRGGKLEKIFKLLRLKLNEEGFANGMNHFLYPTLTSRRGVYFINTKFLPGGDGELEECIDFTISSIQEDMMANAQGEGEPIAAQELRGLNCAQYAQYAQYAQVDGEKCAFCYTCYRVCTHQAMHPDYENSVMQCLKNACYGCGICKTVCPANAISIVQAGIGKAGLQDNTSSTNADRCGNLPGDGSILKKALKIICCENSGEIAVKRMLKHLENIPVEIEIEPVDCGGEISAGMLVNSLEGFENILVLTCMDKACKHFEGNKRSRLHVERARQLLHDSGLDEGRIEYMQVSHAMPYAVEERINSIISLHLNK